MKLPGISRNADETRSVPAGTVIFSEGDTGSEMFGVVSGSVELRHGERITASLGPDEVFGEMALIVKSPRSMSAVAATDSELAVLNEKSFLWLVQETPTFALQVMSAMADRLRQLP